MLDFHTARSQLLELVRPLSRERVELRHACGRVLANDLFSSTSIPRFDSSAMDGYALAFDDLPPNPVGTTLPVAFESRAGKNGPALVRGTAQRIFTGAQLPTGADTVIIQENVTRSESNITLDFAPKRGAHVRHQGEDIATGSLVLRAGTRLTPFQLSCLASLDLTTVLVNQRPRVCVLSTGDELRQPGSPHRDGTIPESNGIALATLAEAAGATVSLLPLVPDNVDVLTPLVEQAVRTSDVVVTIGGVSVGDYDVVHSSLKAAGVSTSFWKVAIKPGKPLTVGQSGNTLVLGLPGNPVSAQVTACLFLLPALRALQGDESPFPDFVLRTLTNDVNQEPGRRGFFRAIVKGDNVTVHGKQGSGAVNSMALANALVTLPESANGARAGERVLTLPLSEI
jgi:molybdopterin molybdotransferase